jgi:signal transduction histidine kinase
MSSRRPHGVDGTPPDEREALIRRRTALFGAAAVASFFPIDPLLGAGVATFAFRSAWVAAIVAFALVRPRSDQRDAFALALVSGVAMVGIAWTGGGVPTEYFRYLHALPLAALVVFPAATPAPAVAGLATLLGGAVLLHARGHGGVEVLAFCAANACSSTLGVVGSLGYRRLRAAERAAQSARLETLEELSESERRRARAERLALLGQLAAGVAHEVNNPLAYASASVRLVREAIGNGGAPAGGSRADLVEALDDASAGLARIQRIVSDLGTFAQEGEPEGRACDATEAVAEAIRLASVRTARVARLEAALPPAGLRVGIEAARLVRAALNVLVNAADAIEDAGRGGRIRVRLRAEGRRVAVDVEDDGPGIPEGVSARLFEPFFTTRGVRGTGLGLAVARQLLLRDGGTIEAGRSEWGGARFTLLLPVAEAAPAEAPAAVPGAPPPAKGDRRVAAP